MIVSTLAAACAVSVKLGLWRLGKQCVIVFASSELAED